MLVDLMKALFFLFKVDEEKGSREPHIKPQF
jgi:hypothetical protein